MLDIVDFIIVSGHNIKNIKTNSIAFGKSTSQRIYQTTSPQNGIKTT